MSKENDPNKKGTEDGEPQETLNERIGNVATTTLWFSVDVYFLYQESYEAALWIGLLFFAFMLIQHAPLSGLIKAIIVTTSVVIGIIVTPYLPSKPLPETETHGWLVPSGGSPPNQSPNALNVMFGSDHIADTRNVFIPIIIRDCTTIIVKRTAKGLALSTDIHSPDGQLVAHIEDNEFYLVQGNIGYRKRSPDRSTLVVYEPYGKEVLSAYVSPNTLFLYGEFFCPGISVIAEPNSVRIKSASVSGNFGGNYVGNGTICFGPKGFNLGGGSC